MSIVPTYQSFRSIFGIFAPPDVTGYSTWPTFLMRADGFDAYDIPKPMPAVNPASAPASPGIVVSVNFNLGPSYLPDAVPGVDEYDWYLSQRTDDATIQNWSIAQYTQGGVDTFSGTVVLMRTVGDVGALPTPPSLTEQFSLTRHCYLYARQRTSPAGSSPIQVVDLTRTYFADV